MIVVCLRFSVMFPVVPKKKSKQLADYSWTDRNYYCSLSEYKSEATPSNQLARQKTVNDFKKDDCGASEITVTEFFFRGSKIHNEPQLMHSVTQNKIRARYFPIISTGGRYKLRYSLCGFLNHTFTSIYIFTSQTTLIKLTILSATT